MTDFGAFLILVAVLMLPTAAFGIFAAWRMAELAIRARAEAQDEQTFRDGMACGRAAERLSRDTMEFEPIRPRGAQPHLRVLKTETPDASPPRAS